ncbi:MAG: DUF262 domain-containing protein [Treponema sp.]|nr:DUF262 domain-containing protein [Treponema sp.]
MGFAQQISIKNAIDKIYQKKYLLPAIQREFVWSTDQIETLFDSIMREYPISSFLFWELDEKNIPKYKFYEFIRNYHERDKSHNEEANLNGEKNIIAILDGQQRLSSLYIGLRGTYAYKIPRMRWENDLAFPERKLCLNILSKPSDSNLEYDFKFLTSEEMEENDDEHFWFEVGKVLSFSSPGDIYSYLMETGISPEEDKYKFATDVLYKLFSVIEKPSINFFLESSDSLDRVLNIFIRTNSGGTKLSYSDLLLSIASAQWKQKDAKKEITRFVDEINKLGDGFNIDKDFVLKTCLVLSDFNDIAFKVDNFNQNNMLTIEKKWDDITNAIRLSYNLLVSFGYNRDSLTSNNAVIPIAYYLLKQNCPDNFDIAGKYKDDRKEIFHWLVSALLKKVFSGQPDNVLRPIRNVIKNSTSSFPRQEIIKKQKGSSKSFTFDEDEIDNLFTYKYGNSFTYSILAIIYPSLNFRGKFHEDHIFPKKFFTEKRLKRLGIPEEDIPFYLDNYNYIANLQLLEGIQNKEKSTKMFDEWIEEEYPNENDRKAYMDRNYIPNCSLDIKNFKEFIKKRTELITKAIKNMLN